MIYKDLLLNITLLVTASLVYGYLIRFLNLSLKRNQVITGILFGVIAILVMTVPVHQKPGIIYDARSVVISIAGLFSGGISVVIAGVLAACYRLWLGGVGVLAGISTIISAAIIGVVAHRQWPEMMYRRNAYFLYSFGVVVTVAMLFSQMFIPQPVFSEIIQKIWLPVLIFFPLGTVLFGLLIAEHEYRNQLTQSLSENEQRYRSLFEKNHVAILLIDPETGEVVDANPAASRFYGWTIEQLCQLHVSDINLLPPDEVQRKLKDSIEYEKNYYEFKHRTADGSTIDVAVYNGPIQLDGRHLLFSHIFDITQRKIAEEELQAREENLQITLNSIGDAVITTDKDGRITRLNPVAERLTGWSRKDAIGHHLTDVFHIIHAKTRELAENPVKKVMASGKIFGLANHTLLISKDGTEYQIADSGAPILDADNQIAGVVLVFRDVTEAYQKEQALIESEEKFKAAFKTSPDAVNLNRVSDGLYIDINEGFTNIMGYTKNDVIGKTSLELNIWKNPEDRKRLVDALEQDGEIQNLEAEFITKNGAIKIGLMSARVIQLQEEPVIISVTRDLTNYKRNQIRFQEIWRSTRDGMRITDKDGIITNVNPAFCVLFQSEKSELVGQPISLLYDENQEHILAKHRERFRAHSIPDRLESEFVLHNGDKKWFDVSNTFIDIPGEPEQVLATFRDITERKHSEEALRRSEERYSRIANTIPGILYDYKRWPDGRTQFLYISPQCKEVFEYDADEIVKNPELLWSVVHPDDLERLQREDLESNQAQKLFQSEVRIVPPSGKTKWIQLTSRPNQPRGDEPAIWSGVILEITEQKEAEEALRKSEHRYRVLMETAPDLVLSHDMDGTIQYANSQVYSVLGFEPNSLIGKNINTLLPDSGVEALQTRRSHRLSGDQGVKFFKTSVYESSGGKIPLEVRTAPMLQNGDAAEIIVIGRDIRDREKLEAQLRQAQKMDAIGRLAGGIAHDFNNKLTVILGQVELALTKVEISERLRKMLVTVQNSARESADLTRQLLGFARKQTTSPEVLDLNETVAGMLSMLRRLIGEDVSLAWIPGAEVWPVKIDPVQIDQVLANLLVNARDAIDGVGKVTIETQNKSFSPEYCVEHPSFSPGEYVMLMVSDSGHGMDDATQKQIFEPFFTTKPQGEGTGLGLATVYGVVKQNKGFIQVESQPGEGARFKIYLVRHTKGFKAEKSRKKSIPVPQGNETILLVEDDENILQLGSILLGQLGYNVMVANSTNDAIQLATNYAHNIHMLLTDVIMPEMNGKDLATKMQEIYPNIRVLFMSGYTADVITHQGVLNQGIQFLQKPFSRESLAKKVREVLDE